MTVSIKNGGRICIFNKIGFNVFYVIMKGVSIITNFKRPTKILLILRNMNYSMKNLIYLIQVYTFQPNQIKFENPKSSLPLKRLIIRF